MRPGGAPCPSHCRLSLFQVPLSDNYSVHLGHLFHHGEVHAVGLLPGHGLQLEAVLLGLPLLLQQLVPVLLGSPIGLLELLLEELSFRAFL